MNELAENEQIQVREMIVEVETRQGTKLKTFGIPLKFSETKAVVSWAAPNLGEDSEAILRELGKSDNEISELKNQKII